MQARQEEQKRKEMLDKRAHEKRFKQMAEERRLAEAHRTILDQMQEESNQKIAQEMHQRDRLIA